MTATLIQSGQSPLRPLRFDQRQKFFWVNDAKRLACAEEILQRVEDLDWPMQNEFWAGKIPKGILAGMPDAVTRASPAEIVDDCRVWRSCLKAKWLLKIKSGGAKGVVHIGDLVNRDEPTAALERIKLGRPLTDLVVKSGVHAAQQADDDRFFHRLSGALKSKAKSAGKKDGTPCEPVDRLLVNNWCGDRHQPDLPPLCFFTDQALADFCLAALGHDLSIDAMHKRRSRLGLEHPHPPRLKISAVVVKEGTVLLS